MFKTVLIDGDVLLYSICRGNERDADFGDLHVLFSSFEECKEVVHVRVQEIQDAVKAVSYKIVVSGDTNWRKDVLPTYKNHRKDVRKPLAFHRTKAWMIEELGAEWADRLEADDVLGIMSEPDNIIASVDKDFFGVAGNFARIGQDGSIEIHKVSEDQARYWHFVQAFMGDKVDGYVGCPGIGPVTSAKKINSRVAVPGQVARTEALGVWKMMVSEYEKADKTIDDAVENFLVAKILDGRDGAYDHETKSVRIALPTGVVHAL